LKHRQKKEQAQRIIVFVGHPIQETNDQCVDLGKRLKKSNVAIDVINFANPENVAKLTGLVNSCNNSNNSHFLDVPLGISDLTEVLFTSPILMGEDVGNSNSALGGAAVSGG
jgi:26S proteasome regulatory subunit N10